MSTFIHIDLNKNSNLIIYKDTNIMLFQFSILILLLITIIVTAFSNTINIVMLISLYINVNHYLLVFRDNIILCRIINHCVQRVSSNWYTCDMYMT